jgi:pyruvate formate lyase activating enzyme
VDTAQACHARGIKMVAVTAGYVCPERRAEFYRHMDAANVDLKAFSEHFYHHITGAHLQPVLETLLYLKYETQVWLEITTLLIPDANDPDQEQEALTQWVVTHLGPDVPLHFTAASRCQFCGTACAGILAGDSGSWGRKRLPVHLAEAITDLL